MKKLILTSLFALTLTLGMPVKQAQAGLLIGALSGNIVKGVLIGVGTGAVLSVTALAADCDGIGCLANVYVFAGAPIVGLVLDVDATESQYALAQGFQKSLPFIDNREVFENLAQMTKEKLNIEMSKNPESAQVMVNFTVDEVTQVLSSTDLSAEQFETVLKVLQ